MKIRYRRTGGVTGMKVVREFDSSELPEHLRNTVETMHGHPDFPTFADDFLHEVEFEDGRKVACYDSRCTPAQLELFDHLLHR